MRGELLKLPLPASPSGNNMRRPTDNLESRIGHMFMSTPRYVHRTSSFRALLTIVTSALIGASCSSQPAVPAITVTADTFAVVNGRQITRADVDKAFLRAQPSTQALSEEETLATKL